MNPNKRALIESVAIGGTMVITEGIDMSSYLHRDNTHNSVSLSPPVKLAAEVINWGLSGMNPLEWKVVHLTHHAFQDRDITEQEFELVKTQYPGAPIEAFRDPHSPIIEGHLNILFKNGLKYYKNAAKAILPYLKQLEADNVPRELWPPHLMSVDLSQSRFEQTIDKIPHGRLLGMIATGATIAYTRGLKVAVATMAPYIPAVLTLGGGVNMLGHTGQVENEIERLRVVLGMQPAVADENGSYASNFFKWLAFFTAGEANHADHHKNPGNPFITSENNPLKDPSSVILKELARHSFRNEPLAVFTNKRPFKKAG